ncbi:hypothetical protein TraAM80_01678 [Trypanosoma rangeli]|uniref:Uncharacterized protein n=1 Tax=Trypanosoma rangeli TaxID=5698 RepID=A0A3R7NQY0_TRYRA|nr:uncharacterized protein TraAM80_01678 [Trypanosoma rangeli]RNF10239.1 hypothetical protein TraAM80_01678 [Trypanosoma rangeli]|eukprot:RNF10239.1 hypothetical protein TraAM80_01678 [Trypanosoma rangeli]
MGCRQVKARHSSATPTGLAPVTRRESARQGLGSHRDAAPLLLPGSGEAVSQEDGVATHSGGSGSAAAFSAVSPLSLTSLSLTIVVRVESTMERVVTGEEAAAVDKGVKGPVSVGGVLEEAPTPIVGFAAAGSSTPQPSWTQGKQQRNRDGAVVSSSGEWVHTMRRSKSCTLNSEELVSVCVSNTTVSSPLLFA